MGLDLQIYRARKTKLEKYTLYERYDADVSIKTSDVNDSKNREIIPYCSIRKIMTHRYNLNQIRKDYDLSDNAYIGMQCGYEIGIHDPKDNRVINIPGEIVEAKYTIDEIQDMYVCDLEEVAYWRKEYEIQKWFHDHIEAEIENTGFYILSADLIREFNAEFPNEELPVEEPDEYSALFYWEWY